MAELQTPPGHPAQTAALAVASLLGVEVRICPPDADLQEPLLRTNGQTVTGIAAVLVKIAGNSNRTLFPDTYTSEIEAWLAKAGELEVILRPWLQPTAAKSSDEARAASQAAIISQLGEVEARLAGAGAPAHVTGGALTIADIALAATLAPLFAAVLGAAGRAPYPATTAWLQALHSHPGLAKALGPFTLCTLPEPWSPPGSGATPGSAGKKQTATSGSNGAALTDGAAAAAAGAEGEELDPIKAAKKAAKAAEKAAKAAKVAAKQAAKAEAAAAAAAAAAAPKAGGGEKKASAKAEAEAKKRAEAEEVARLLAEVQGIPKGTKKDTSKAAAKAYNPRIVEAAWYDWWEQCGFFKPDTTSDKPPFVMVIPPPNVTGALHIGHALTNSVQDTIVRWRRMSGYNVVWVPGTDHAGIATQTVVEKQLLKQGKTRHDLGRDAFVGEVWKWVGEYGGRICDQLRRLGSSVDWSRLVFTLDDKLSRAVNEAFVRMYEAGVVYRDNRLVNWCCKLRTAVSDIEVDYVDIPKRTKMAVPGYTELVEFGAITSFAYPIEGGDGEIVVATTRPETMLGDTAVAVHPDDPRYKAVQGKFVVHPVDGRRLPIICDAELVDMAFGTGAVKITPAHDPNDFKVGKRHGLDFINIFDDNGLINDRGGQFVGQPRFQARVTVVEFLRSKGLFRGVADNEMRLGICSRSKDVIEPMLKPQWWVKCDTMAARSCEAVRTGELEIIPKEFEAVWFRWLENIRDWCISRQLWWGHRIPAYYVTLTDEAGGGGSPGSPSEEMGRWVVGRTRADAEAAAAAAYPGRAFTLSQDEDVLDTWFSSGLFPFSVFGWPEQSHDLKLFYPGALLETGHDILFFWVARMVMQGLQLTGQVPFKQVYLHAMVRDAHGRKMSKSLGNVIDPLHVIEGITLQGLHNTLLGGNLDAKEIEKAKKGQAVDFPDGIEECGTDALRFALVAYTSQARDINLDIKRVVAYRHWCNKLYNAIRFASMNLPDDYVPPADPLTLDTAALPLASRWLLSRLSNASGVVVKAMEAYDFSNATQRIYAFWQYEVCDVYIEVMKPYMALDDSVPEQAAAKRRTRDALWVALEAGLRLLHPFMPFVTEELWQRLPKNPAAKVPESIMLAAYPTAVPAWEDAVLEAEVEHMQAVVTRVRKLRGDYGLLKQKARLFLTVSSAERAAALKRLALDIATLSTSSEVVVLGPGDASGDGPPLGCGVAIVDDTTTAHLLLVGVLDPALEIAKLQKKLGEVEGKLEGIDKRCAMPGYAERTPEAVKAEDQDRRQKLEAEKATALAAIADMQALLESGAAGGTPA